MLSCVCGSRRLAQALGFMRPSLTDIERHILANGPSGPEDYEIVRRLCDYGYTDSKLQLSKQKDTYGQVTRVAWLGANTNGRLALEARLSESDNSSPVKDEKSNHIPNALKHKVFPKPESALRAIAISVFAAILVACAFLLLREHLGIVLK